MNEDIIQGKWNDIKGSLQAKFGKLTTEDLDRVAGNHDYLVGKLEQRYGYDHQKAEQEVKTFEKSINRAA